MENEKKQLNIEMKPDVPKVYSNLAIISHSHSEFVIDFATMLPPSKTEVGCRIIMAPEHVKRLMAAIADNISKYESQFGTIEIPGQPQPQATINLADIMPNGAKS